MNVVKMKNVISFYDDAEKVEVEKESLFSIVVDFDVDVVENIDCFDFKRIN